MREVALPDGSTATVEPRGGGLSLVSRWVDGQCVWGQAFSRPPSDPEAHAGQVAEVLDAMALAPGNFARWWL